MSVKEEVGKKQKHKMIVWNFRYDGELKGVEGTDGEKRGFWLFAHLFHYKMKDITSYCVKPPT